MGPYRNNILVVLCQRLFAIPSMVFAPWFLTKASSKRVQMAGFVGCCLANLTLALGYQELQQLTLVFSVVYCIQLSFQSLPGVTTLAISAEIYPSAVKGTGAAISSTFGKFGATFGSFFFTVLKERGSINEIFWAVTCTSLVAWLLTCILTPRYNGAALDLAEELANEGDTAGAVAILYAGPRDLPKMRDNQKSQVVIE